jgi:iron complex outermembrane receptor protein
MRRFHEITQRGRVLLTAVVPMTFLAGTAHAQAALPASAAPAQVSPAASAALQEVIVTAQKRSENIQSVPISVTAVSAEAISQMHATDLQDLQGTLPNVQLDHFSSTPNSAAIYIRGIGVNDPDPYTGNTVSIVVDGVPQYFSDGALVDLLDISRIEVLRGPQGTLFGANSTGGAINVISAAPDNKLGGDGEVTLGNFSRVDVKGAVTIPMSDSLSARFSVLHHQEDGFVTNIVNGRPMGDQSLNLFRASLKWRPTEDFAATLISEYDRTDNGSGPEINGAVPGERRYLPPGTVLSNALLPMYQSPCVSLNQPCHAPATFYGAIDQQVPDSSDLDNLRETLTLNWHGTPIGDLTAITGYRHFKLDDFGDTNSTPVVGNALYRPTRGWQFSQELRDDIKWMSIFNSTLGVFYLDDHYHQIQNLLTQSTAPGFSQINIQDQGNHSISAFAQNYLNITSKLRLQAGVRFTSEYTSMKVDQSSLTNPSGVAQFNGGIVTAHLAAHGAHTWNDEGWKVGLDYQALDHAMLYAYWARGFKSGGFVGRISTPAAIGPFNPELVDTYEGGIKTDLLDRRLRFNADVFYTNYRDMQLPQINYLPNAQGVVVQANTVLNVPRAMSRGVELETIFQPIAALTLNASAAYLDAKYLDFCFVDTTYHPASGQSDPGCPMTSIVLRNMNGFALQNSPPWTATAGATYQFKVGPGTASAHVLYSFTAKKYLSAINDSPRATIQPKHLANANLDWTPNNGNWTISLWSTNIFDRHYIQQSLDLPGQWALVLYDPPRQFGGTVKVTF